MKLGALLLLATGPLPAALLTDRIGWGTSAANYELTSSPLTVTSQSGNTIQVTQEGPAFQRLNQSDGWYGNFLPGEELLWTYFGGPVTIHFGPAGATAIAFQIQSDLYGAFSAQLELLDSTGSLVGSLTGTGISTPLGDGSALLLTLGGTNFQSARVRLLSGGDLSSFALNSIQFTPGALAAYSVTLESPSAVPEPGTLGLAAAILLILITRKLAASASSI